MISAFLMYTHILFGLTLAQIYVMFFRKREKHAAKAEATNQEAADKTKAHLESNGTTTMSNGFANGTINKAFETDDQDKMEEQKGEATGKKSATKDKKTKKDVEAQEAAEDIDYYRYRYNNNIIVIIIVEKLILVKL